MNIKQCNNGKIVVQVRNVKEFEEVNKVFAKQFIIWREGQNIFIDYDAAIEIYEVSVMADEDMFIISGEHMRSNNKVPELTYEWCGCFPHNAYPDHLFFDYKEFMEQFAVTTTERLVDQVLTNN